jgi:hypothetical protein
MFAPRISPFLVFSYLLVGLAGEPPERADWPDCLLDQVCRKGVQSQF